MGDFRFEQLFLNPTYYIWLACSSAHFRRQYNTMLHSLNRFSDSIYVY